MKKSVDMIPKNLSSIAPFSIIDVRQDEEVLNNPILGEFKHIKMDELLNNSSLIDPKQNVVFVCAQVFVLSMWQKFFGLMDFPMHIHYLLV